MGCCLEKSCTDKIGGHFLLVAVLDETSNHCSHCGSPDHKSYKCIDTQSPQPNERWPCRRQGVQSK